MKVLIVDDSLFFKSFMLKLFAKYLPECDLITASNGSEGFYLYQQEKPQVVLTDLLMPGLNGQELIKQIRAGDANTKIIVISADVQKAIRQEVEQMGVLAFFNKPLNDEKANQLISLLKEAFHA